jgi:microsomal dipeptidase-like Zn-dependent dipeptidase
MPTRRTPVSHLFALMALVSLAAGPSHAAAPAKLPTGPKLPSANLPNGGKMPSPKLPPNTPVPKANIDNWGFERGLDAWQKTGNAFDDQPTWGDNVRAHRVINSSTSHRMPLGGDYWRDVAFPVGHKGTRWIGTYEKRRQQSDPAGATAGDGRTGTLTSKPFSTDRKYITFLIGGGKDATRLRVELLEKVASAGAGTVSFSDGPYRVVGGTAKTGHGNELLRREWWDLGSRRNKTLRIRIADEATGGWGHINVDDFQFQNTKPATTNVQVGGRTIRQVKAHVFREGDASSLGFVDWDSPVWGIADLHTHPASHLGFGKKLLHGEPDGSIATAMDNCNCTHGGWGVDNTCGNYIRMAVVTMTDGIYKHTADLDHPHAGAPGFRHWPHFTTVTHQQMRVEWIKRAHEGGLRVMVGLAVNNQLLAEVLDGDNPKDDKASADAQIDFMKAFVGRHSFMEIARDPAELRDIVRRGKLAVVLGIEVDNIGNFNYATKSSSDGAIKAEIRRLHGKGVRYVFPVHVTDNKFGGAAVYEDMFNYANRFAAVQPLPPDVGAAIPGQSFQLERAPDPLVTKRLGLPLENVWAVGIRGAIEAIEHMPSPALVPMKVFLEGESEYKVLKSFFLTPDPATEVWKTIQGGHRNKRTLTSKGRVAIEEMMRLGMVIDLDHMSEKTVGEVITMAEGVPGGYPLVSGHNTFRAMSAQGHGSENQRTDAQAQRLVNLGGMMGVGWGYEKDEGKTPSFSATIGKHGGRAWTTSSVDSTCGGSSRSFANNYLYALEQMGGASVGLGSDINGLVSGPGPRFGPDARYDGNRCSAQRDGVKYVGVASSGASTATNVPLTLHKDGTRRWNINRDGVAHYGMLPDFLQDLDNVGVDAHDMSPLFNSAEEFARMWSKALQVAPD